MGKPPCVRKRDGRKPIFYTPLRAICATAEEWLNIAARELDKSTAENVFAYVLRSTTAAATAGLFIG